MNGELSLEQPLEDCKVGEQKEITLLVTPTKNDDTGFTADVDEVKDYEEAGGDSADKTETSDSGQKMDSMKHAPAIAIIIGGKKK